MAALETADLATLNTSAIAALKTAQIQALLTAMPQAKWIQYEAIGRDNVRAGAKLAFGEYVEAQYRLDQADVILSLDADLLDSGPGKLRYARDFAARRRVTPGHTAMTRLYVAESTPSNTGSKADHRIALKSREIPALVRPDSELYAVPALAGALVVAAAEPLHHAQSTIAVSAAVFIFVFRLVALRRGWHAPRAWHRRGR